MIFSSQSSLYLGIFMGDGRVEVNGTENRWKWI